ncbi:MAG: tyrosine-type recombinase/integrase, partial [Pseudomonadota bacterium]
AVYKPMKAILRLAAKHGMCAPPMIDSPTVKDPVVRAAGDEYLNALLPHVPERILAVVLIATDNAARTSEILSLEWENVNLARAEAEILDTKNGKPFLLALTDRAVVALANIEGERKDKVFKFSRNVVNRDLKKAREAAGLPYMKLHQIGRHTFAERLLKHGHTLNTVMQAGNWKDIRVVSKNYGHMERGLIHDIVRNPKGKVAQ